MVVESGIDHRHSRVLAADLLTNEAPDTGSLAGDSMQSSNASDATTMTCSLSDLACGLASRHPRSRTRFQSR